MIIVASIEAVVVAVVVVAFLRFRATEQATIAIERRELLNRIQHPQIMPVQPAENFDVPEQEPDDSVLVGTIDYGND